MDLLTQILLSFCLATDAFAVSVSNGICSMKITGKDVIATALTFGLFQSTMPVLGYILGNGFSNIISKYQHFAALFILSAIGLNMIADAIKEIRNPEVINGSVNVFSARNLIMQGIATSIDALAAGISLLAIEASIAATSFIIGSITFICCAIGVYIGRRFGMLLGIRAKFVGGVLLILIGIKIFAENTAL